MKVPQKTLKQLYKRAGDKCEHCKGIDPNGYNSWRLKLYPHHIKYRSRGGSDELINLALLCTICHADTHLHKGEWSRKYRSHAWQPEGDTEADIIDVINKTCETCRHRGSERFNDESEDICDFGERGEPCRTAWIDCEGDDWEERK